MISRLILFFFLLVICKTSSAQVGCLAPSGNLYTLNSGSTYNGAPRYNWNGSITDPNRISAASTTRCIRRFTPARSCYIRYDCNGGGNNCTYDLGEEVNYTPLPCPVDDYIPFLVLVTGVVGGLFLKKNQLSLFIR